MAGIQGVNYYGYVAPQQTNFTARKQGEVAAVFSPENGQERKKKTTNAVVTGIGIIAAALILKNTKIGKKFLSWLKGLFKKKPTLNPVHTGKPKPKVPGKGKVVQQHVDLQPGQKLKMKNGGGKNAVRKARKNKNAIIEATRQLEQEASKPLTRAELEATGTLHQAATAEERAFMAANNKPATNSIADFMERDGLVRGRQGRRVAIVPKPQAATAAPAAQVIADTPNTSRRILQIENSLKSIEAQIEKYSKPGMERWAKPFQAQKAKLEAELAQLKVSAAA